MKPTFKSFNPEAPVITPEDIQSLIHSKYTFRADDVAEFDEVLYVSEDSNDTVKTEPRFSSLTFCVLLLVNGHQVVGVNYGSIDPKKFSAERGRQEAEKHAMNQLWDLAGILLRNDVYQFRLEAAAKEASSCKGDCSDCQCKTDHTKPITLHPSPGVHQHKPPEDEHDVSGYPV